MDLFQWEGFFSMGGKLIFDVGMNVGQDTAFYLLQGDRVLAIEADPTLADAGRKHFQREIENGNLEILNVGIFEEEGFADFWISEGRPNFNSFHKDIAARDGYPHYAVRVPTLRFATVLERYGTPYYLKIDIEGNDQMCIDALNSRSLPMYISVESECPTTNEPIGVESGLLILRKLHDLGYRRFKLIDQRTFCSLSVPPSANYICDRFARYWLQQSPLNRIRGTYRLSKCLMTRSRLERKYRQEFPIGSSGVWGEDTSGSWTDFEQAERIYRYYRGKHFQDPNSPSRSHYSFWCDWHAKV